MKLPIAWFSFVSIAGGAAWLVWLLAFSSGTNAWQRYVQPGELSNAHAFLSADCGACHTAVQGPEDLKCVGCHASESDLLLRQPTAFHADVSNCGGCHVEHLGAEAPLRRMNHDLFARIVFQAKETAGTHKPMSERSSALECYACHATKDRHQALFGTDCRHCHATTEWTSEKFLHPSADSVLCVQCHRAPPSHYMMHFEMVSVSVVRGEAGDVPGCCGPVTVDQCYRCHQPTSWNDIKGVGWYKHH